MSDNEIELSCACGNVGLKSKGHPIVSAECLCIDCQKAGTNLQKLHGTSSVVDQNGATRFVLYRKDRIQCHRGQDYLREYRLTRESKTRRVIATCCNTPVFLEFSGGHWLSIYAGVWPKETLPLLEIRTMTRDKPEGVDLPDNVPNPSTHTLSFYMKLFIAWAAMGFRVPKIDYVNGELDV